MSDQILIVGWIKLVVSLTPREVVTGSWGLFKYYRVALTCSMKVLAKQWNHWTIPCLIGHGGGICAPAGCNQGPLRYVCRPLV